MRINQNNLIRKDVFALREKLLLAFIVLAMIPLFFAARNFFTGFAQTKSKDEKNITKAAFSFSNEPIEIVMLGNSERSVKLDEKFNQKTDWLKDFKVEIKNKFSKNITYILLKLEFPETLTSGNIMAFPLSYGKSPVTSAKNEEKVSVIKPEETVDIVLSEKKYSRLKSFIEKRHSLDTLSKIEIRTGFILFEDGTAWTAGDFVRSDPNAPGKFISNDSKEGEN